MDKTSMEVDTTKPEENSKKAKRQQQHHQQQQHQDNQDVIKNEPGQIDTHTNNLLNKIHSDEEKPTKLASESVDSAEPSISSGTSSNDIAQEMIFKDVQDILDNDLSCAICQDIYVNPLILNCSHSFCKFCVYMWLSKKKGCPQCRVRVTFQAENLALRNIINKMVSKSPPQFRELREGVVKSRLNEEQKLEKNGLPPVLRKQDHRGASEDTMALESIAVHLSSRVRRFLSNHQDHDHHYYHETESDDDPEEVDIFDAGSESDSSDDNSHEHLEMLNRIDWDGEYDDSEDVSFHIDGDNTGDSDTSNLSSDSEDEVHESDEEDNVYHINGLSSSSSSTSMSSGETSPEDSDDEWPVIEINGISDDDTIQDIDTDSDDEPMDPIDRRSDDSTVEYDNDSDQSIENSDFYGNSDTEIDEDEFW